MLLLGLARDRLPELVKELSVSAVVCDFAPLRVPMGWVNDVSVEMDKLGVPLVQVSVPPMTIGNGVVCSLYCVFYRGKYLTGSENLICNIFHIIL